MTEIYLHHRIATEPRQWRAVADVLHEDGPRRLGAANGALYGIWRSQIGRPRDELAVMTVWPDADAASEAEDVLLRDLPSVEAIESVAMTPTLRPQDATPPRRQGNFAFRWFETPAEHWDEFLELCEAAWPGFESSYDSQVIGLWWCLGDDDALRRSLLLTRRPNLAMWERSKIPEGETEMDVRRKLNRRYDICDWTCVYTTTLLTAEDEDDTVRWT
ncbi:MAG: hypothetical protein MJE12_27710 [Alphaproteobacteria bacterium]|nr:hypothetical protein [Alphaproteobacteria bacterium]